MFLDLPALAQSLQQVPLHRRLNLEAELVQVGASSYVSGGIEVAEIKLWCKRKLGYHFKIFLSFGF